MLTDNDLLALWRSVAGPHAGLTGPLIRFAAKVQEAAEARAASAEQRYARACECSEPDPVMQADSRFYCHTCSFQTGARPAHLEPESLFLQLASAEQENTALRDNNRAVKALFDDKALQLASAEQELTTLKEQRRTSPQLFRVRLADELQRIKAEAWQWAQRLDGRRYLSLGEIESIASCLRALYYYGPEVYGDVVVEQLASAEAEIRRLQQETAIRPAPSDQDADNALNRGACPICGSSICSGDHKLYPLGSPLSRALRGIAKGKRLSSLQVPVLEDAADHIEELEKLLRERLTDA